MTNILTFNGVTRTPYEAYLAMRNCNGWNAAMGIKMKALLSTHADARRAQQDLRDLHDELTVVTEEFGIESPEAAQARLNCRNLQKGKTVVPSQIVNKLHQQIALNSLESK